MNPLHIQSGSASSSGEGAVQSERLRQWTDDVVGASVLVVTAYALGSRAVRWSRTRAEHPKDLLDVTVHQLKGAAQSPRAPWAARP